ncbi:MAG: type transport system ATP-binding protein [Acidobacteriota bacterium]|jgi:ABC-2 type transport system ATP-binding protein|nr:type transport system ATP-binding protein [Acidobacteriota bacterium]
MTNVIEVEALTVRYGKRTAVERASLAIPAGSVYALLGRNGAGKSSLVRCLLGQQKPSEGHVTLFGRDVWRDREELMQRVGIVSEEADAPPDMRVSSIAKFCARLYREWQQSAFDSRLERWEITPSARFGNLSKGQKKQVSLALALSMTPELIVLDDPTLGLDVVARKSLFEEVIGELAERGITVFLTTHDLAGIETLADRIAIMKNGRVVLEEELETLKSRFRRIRTTTAAEPEGVVTSRKWGSGAEAIVSNYDEAAAERFAAAEVAALSLEEIFIAVDGDGGVA